MGGVGAHSRVEEKTMKMMADGGGSNGPALTASHYENRGSRQRPHMILSALDCFLRVLQVRRTARLWARYSAKDARPMQRCKRCASPQHVECSYSAHHG